MITEISVIDHGNNTRCYSSILISPRKSQTCLIPCDNLPPVASERPTMTRLCASKKSMSYTWKFSNLFSSGTSALASPCSCLHSRIATSILRLVLEFPSWQYKDRAMQTKKIEVAQMDKPLKEIHAHEDRSSQRGLFLLEVVQPYAQ